MSGVEGGMQQEKEKWGNMKWRLGEGRQSSIYGYNHHILWAFRTGWIASHFFPVNKIC